MTGKSSRAEAPKTLEETALGAVNQRAEKLGPTPQPCQLSDFWSCPCSSQLHCVGSEEHPGCSFSSRYLSQQPSESSGVLTLLGPWASRCTTHPSSHSGYVASLKLARAGDFIPWNSANAAKQGFLPSHQSWLLNIYQSITALALAKIREKGQ